MNNQMLTKSLNLLYQLSLATCLTVIHCSRSGIAQGLPPGQCNGEPCVHGSCDYLSASFLQTTESLYIQSPAVPVISPNGSCVCNEKWSGPTCEIFTCSGRVTIRSSDGVISDGTSNYTTDNRCTWLIIGSVPNIPIRFNFTEFATECAWDHLYIFDGSSAWSPLIAVLSGLISAPDSQSSGGSLQNIVATSGSAYLHFYSDAAYYMSGFNVQFMQSPCPQNCSGHGNCSSLDGAGICACNNGWTGAACDMSTCPSNCSYPTYGECVDNVCQCKPGYGSTDCSISDSLGTWSKLKSAPISFTSHGAITIGRYLWVVHGYNFQQARMSVAQPPQSNVSILRYSFDTDDWEIQNSESQTIPVNRYGHSIAVDNTLIYMFGGMIGGTVTDELWKFDTEALVWTILNTTSDNKLTTMGPTQAPSASNKSSQPPSVVASVGHTAHIIDRNMYVIFGYSQIYGYLSIVQVFNLDTLTWSQLNTSGGAVAIGGYGHSSVYDPLTNCVVVHGGYFMFANSNISSSSLSDALYQLNITSKQWRRLTPSGQYKYLHSAVIINRLMLVFGGNTHNDTSSSQGAKCYAADFYAYDIDCDTWYTLPAVNDSVPWEPTSRFGHAANVYNNTMYVFGGFNGLVLSDLYVFRPGDCSSIQYEQSCTLMTGGAKCSWDDFTQKCSTFTFSNVSSPVCPASNLSLSTLSAYCRQSKTCPSCIVNSIPCKWCTNGCLLQCGDAQTVASSYSSCLINASSSSQICSTLDNCQECVLTSTCFWNIARRTCDIITANTQKAALSVTCETPCSMYPSCDNCTSQAGCMWCSNEQRCVDSNSYVISFPYGQCIEWTTRRDKCPATECSQLISCSSCQENMLCGWCNAAEDTGLGQCMQGALEGPITGAGYCIGADVWYFEDCPLCQCNGHSTCAANSSECSSCSVPTTGLHCDSCDSGYWGNPSSGGNCTECECNDQAVSCNPDSGVCYCFTRGVIGDQCQLCDQAHKYYGDPTTPGGTCYYELAIDWIFTFNLSNDENKSHTHINFMNTPPSPDKDVDFNINCSSPALMNITVKSAQDWNETVLISNATCLLYSTTFSAKEFVFGNPDLNTTFYVYIYNFQTPFIIQMYFSQTDQLDLLRFFITFFRQSYDDGDEHQQLGLNTFNLNTFNTLTGDIQSPVKVLTGPDEPELCGNCFFSLLLIAFVAWKLKQRYDIYRRGQRRMQEMAEMASRPFAMCTVDVEPWSQQINVSQTSAPPCVVDRTVVSTSSQQRASRIKIKRECKASPIALEPLFGHKAAVLSVVVLLPRGDEDFTLPDQCGIAIGSTLVTLGGHTRRSSVEQSSGRGSERTAASKRHKHIVINPASTAPGATGSVGGVASSATVPPNSTTV